MLLFLLLVEVIDIQVISHLLKINYVSGVEGKSKKMVLKRYKST